MTFRRTHVPVLFSCVLLVCRFASAQAVGSIVGTVRDATGEVLPGVTVEAASPALIEKMRTALTDGQGAYRIVDLRPGTYTVTFALPGFTGLKRTDIELVSGFTATVNAELKVGALEETVTVTGATPIVDVQNVRTQQVLTSTILEALPTGTKSLMQIASLTLGATSARPGLHDVGGDKGEQATGITLHGTRGNDGKSYWDGFNANIGAGGDLGRVYYFNTVAVQEVVVDTGGNTAESAFGGASVNMVPKDGGNTFRVYALANYTDSRFSAKGIPDSVADRGVSPQSSLKRVYEYGLGVGGPLKRDKLWFYSANRWWGSQNYGIGNYFNKSTSNFQYVPDLSRPAFTDTFFRDNSVRLTWQAAAKHKINQEVHHQHGCLCSQSASGNSSPDAGADSLYGPQVLSQTTWSYAATNRLLVQGGFSWLHQSVGWSVLAMEGANKFTAIGKWRLPTTIAITELVGVPGGAPAGYSWGGWPSQLDSAYTRHQDASNQHGQFKVSYITASHALRTGLEYQHIGSKTFRPGDVGTLTYTFQAGRPSGLTQVAAPFNREASTQVFGLFAQDQWTIKRLTLNLGIRYDWLYGSTPAVTVPAGPFIGERSFAGVDNLPNFHDISPRLGAVYDLFGNGRTAVKAFWGRYLAPGGALSGFSPASAVVSTVTRTWNDRFFDVGDPRRDNFVPDCMLTNPLDNDECGQISNLAFGQPVINSTITDSARTGWNVRQFHQQANVQLQHELRPGLGASVGYFYTSYGNDRVTQNTLVTPADFQEYCITAPVDARLGATSGDRICGLYNVNRNKFGQVQTLQRLAEDLGATPQDFFHGVDTAVTARFGRGILLTGGVTVGRQTVDICYANGRPDITSVSVNYPRTDEFCRVASSWWDGIGSQVKLQAVYPLPMDFVVSGTFKALPGNAVTANQVLGNAQVAPELGRNLGACQPTGACTATVSVGLIPNAGGSILGFSSATVQDERLNQTDIRLSKIIRVGRNRIQGLLDVYNVFNSRTPQSINTTFGTSWLRPLSLLGGRLFKFGAQFDW